MEQIVNKFKFQLNAKGIDNIQQLKDIFMVSPSHATFLSSSFLSRRYARMRPPPFLSMRFNNCNLI
jgi:hypothetical protein